MRCSGSRLPPALSEFRPIRPPKEKDVRCCPRREDGSPPAGRTSPRNGDCDNGAHPGEPPASQSLPGAQTMHVSRSHPQPPGRPGRHRDRVRDTPRGRARTALPRARAPLGATAQAVTRDGPAHGGRCRAAGGRSRERRPLRQPRSGSLRRRRRRLAITRPHRRRPGNPASLHWARACEHRGRGLARAWA